MSNSPWSDFPDTAVGSQNPYAPTEFTTNLPMGSASDIETRNKYLSHEVSVQGIGALYLLGGVIGFIACFYLIGISIFSILQGNVDEGISLVIGLFGLAISYLQYWLGRGLRLLNPAVRTVAIIFSVIGLLGIPFGTIINAYFLYLLASKKGEFVFSEEYARVRAATPDIKYRTSWVAWAFLILLILLIVMLVVAAVLGA